MKKRRFVGFLSSLLAGSLFLGVSPGWAAPVKDSTSNHHLFEEGEIDRTLDSDGDGLKDYFEQGLTHSFKADTDGNGITDDQEDSDADGLSNKEEQAAGTDPASSDSDGDALSDFDEIHRLQTDPLQFDTDGDNLADGTEVLYYGLNPKQADQNANGIADGNEPRAYSLPANEYSITGTVIGMGDLPLKVAIRQTPILLVQQVKAGIVFDLDSLDPSAEFRLQIPLGNSQAGNDWQLFRYAAKQAHLVPVQKQQMLPAAGAIAAEFTGGGTFVVLPRGEWLQSLQPEAAAYKGRYKPFAGTGKVVGMPGCTIAGDQISADGRFEVKGKNGEKAVYKVDEMQVSGGTVYVSAEAVTIESGKTPLILLHGLNSSTTAWGFNNKWSNGGYEPSASSSISSTETFSGKTYASGTVSSFSNIDVHFITSVSDSTELGAFLAANKGYTKNVDLFAFEYYNNGHVGIAAAHLKDFIANMRAAGKIGPDVSVNLMGHSKGGLVSRYFIENLAGSYDVARLLTLGTPHFGSDLSTFGDMDRDDSDLWLGGDHDAYCDTFTNNHPATRYFAFGGFKASATDLNQTSPSLRGMHTVGRLAGSYDADVRDRFKKTGNTISWWSYGDIEDGVVNIDSTMGSDKDPDYGGTLPTLYMQQRWYVFHETYGDHSTMRKYSLVQSLVPDIMDGLWDY